VFFQGDTVLTYGIFALGMLALGMLVTAIASRRRGADRFSQRLGKSLLLAAGSDLSTNDASIDASTGTPYRVIEVHGRTVLIEIQHPDGSTVRGYTTSAHVRT
jgi:hypothetical protein